MEREGTSLASWANGFALTVACLAHATAALAEPLRVSDGFLRDPQGRAVILRGVNLSNAHKKPPYFDFHGPADYQRIQDAWSMNAVRFLISWAAIEPERGRYDTVYLDEVARRMDWVAAAGLFVILDMHQDVYGEGFAEGAGNGAPRWTCPERYYERFRPVDPWFFQTLQPGVLGCLWRFWNGEGLQQRFVLAWEQVARRLAGKPAVIGFDIFNEPIWFSPFFERAQLAPLYERVVARVRAHAPGWVAVVEPSAARNGGFSTHLRPFTFDQVVYAPHSYDFRAESGQGFDPRRRRKILKHVAEVAQEARGLGAALLIGEYGGMSERPGIEPYMAAQYDAAGEVAAGNLYWQYSKKPGDPYAMLEADGSEIAPLLRALVRPYPERVAGNPISYAFNPESREFRLDWTPSATIDAPTVIAVPPRLYPAGFQAEVAGCASCRFGSAGNRLLVHAPSGRLQALRLTLTPSRNRP